MMQVSGFFLNRFRLFGLVLALGLMGAAWVNLGVAGRGLTIRTFREQGLPMRYMVPEDAGGVPGVLIGHGFGGSQQLMLGYAYTLAQAGYGVMLWDFNGHAANAGSFDRDSDVLQANIETAYATLIRQAEINPEQVALVGHSMGSGAVMSAGIRHPERYQAVVALSPTGAEVSLTAPPNLLLQAGEWEPNFVENAEILLQQAGGENGDLANGLGRKLILIPYAEHILILFQPDSHQETLNWLNATFELSNGSEYSDSRMIFYLLHLGGALGLVLLLGPLFRSATPLPTVPLRPILLGVAPFLATGTLFLLNQWWDVAQVGGVLVGGGLGIWFGVMGVVGLGGVGVPASPSLWQLGRGLLLFVVLWLAFGLLAQYTWLPWFLTWQRLLLWVPLAAVCLPWFLAWGQLQAGKSAGKRVLWWLGQTGLTLVGLVMLINVVPTMGVLFLVLPLLPIVFGVMVSAGTLTPHPWSFAFGSTLFFSWLLLAYFPLAS